MNYTGLLIIIGKDMTQKNANEESSTVAWSVPIAVIGIIIVATIITSKWCYDKVRMGILGKFVIFVK